MISGKKARALSACAAALLTGAQGARANPFELFGFTARGQGLGGATTALSEDMSGAYYNPAGMIGHTKTEFSLGLSANLMQLHIDRTSANSGNASSLPDSMARAELGLVFPFGGAIFKDRVVLGLTLGHPVGGLVRVQTVDQSRPQFYMYQSKPQRFATSATLGIKIVDGLSIGFGTQVIAEQVGKVRFQVDLAAKRFVARDISIDLNTKPKPLAGVLIEPADWLRIGFSWRMEADLYYEQPTDLDLGDVGDLKLDVRGTAQYWPHVFSLGTAFKPSKKWTITVQLDYLLWSRAPRDQVSVTITPQGGVLDGLGLSDILGFGSADAATGFSNIFWPRVGVEWSPSDFLAFRGGAWVRPAITPDQTGNTNYLDNFSESVNLGMTYKFIDPLKVFTEAVSLDLAASAIFANERSHKKKSAVDPTGGASFGGAVLSFGANLRYLY